MTKNIRMITEGPPEAPKKLVRAFGLPPAGNRTDMFLYRTALSSLRAMNFLGTLLERTLPSPPGFPTMVKKMGSSSGYCRVHP